MKCRSCDAILRDHEDARKYLHSPNTRVELCDKCLEGLDIETTGMDESTSVEEVEEFGREDE